MTLLINLATKLKRSSSLLPSPLALHLIFHPSNPSTRSYSSATHPSLLSPATATATATVQCFRPHQFPLRFSPSQTLYETIGFNLVPTETKDPGGVDRVVEILKKTNHFSPEEAICSLDAMGIQPTGGLVCSVIWELRNEWKLAMLVFRWSEKCGSSDSRAFDLMIWVLGQQGRFAKAWRIIRHMLRSSMDARQALLIMIQSYAGANAPYKSIQTFQAMQKFRVSQDLQASYTLLHALCKNGNIEEAEEFMQLNKKFFPLQIEGFNIILNGWCNVYFDLNEAKRVWREMSNCCITPDAISYTHMISCYAKAGNLFNSLRLYDEMKKRGWIPSLDVYNSLIYVLTRDSCLKEAFNLVNKIKEAGLQPDSTTYNSMILPLCEARKLEEAKSVLNDMVRVGLKLTTETYHAFFVVESADGTVELLKQMRETGCGPYGHTFLVILKYKLLESKQPEDALRMWMEMMKHNVVPNSTHYGVMVRGLVGCGWHAKAKKFHDDMKLRGFPDDPTLDKLFKVEVDGEHEKPQERRHKEDIHSREKAHMQEGKSGKKLPCKDRRIWPSFSGH